MYPANIYTESIIVTLPLLSSRYIDLHIMLEPGCDMMDLSTGQTFVLTQVFIVYFSSLYLYHKLAIPHC